MAKDTIKKRYLNPGIPIGSELLKQLEDDHRQTGVSESQLLVLYAARYTELCKTYGWEALKGGTPATKAQELPTMLTSTIQPDQGLSADALDEMFPDTD